MKEFSLSYYDYRLPDELIAYYPGSKDGDKLLVLERQTSKLKDCSVRDLIEYLNKDILVVFNNTKVVPARLLGKKIPSGGKVDCILTSPMDKGKKKWQVLIKPASRLKPGQEILFEGVFEAIYLGERIVEFSQPITLEMLERYGRMPLPPYIKRLPGPEDKFSYQTVYAKHYGAIAAPTAGLHFSKELMEELKKKVWAMCYVTLHVGYGTFSPIREEDIRKHRMHKEFFIVEEESMGLLKKAKEERKKILAVGTTVVRVLESIADRLDEPRISGWTDIYIYPPYEFKMVDILFTNFHLPKSSLLLLVSAFAGRDNIMKAYQHAIDKRYRFFSYGDAMLIL